VRVLDTVATADARGKHFVRFAIDVQPRFSENGEWTEGAFLGCVYLDEKQVFIEQGSDYVPASKVLTGEGEPLPDVCRAKTETQTEVAAAAGT